VSSLLDIASDIDLDSAEPYLRATGWELAHQGELGNRWRLRRHGRVRNIAMPLPILDADDRARMLAAALDVLVDVEHRDASVIARDLSHAHLDLLEFRLIAESLTEGEMPLRAAPELTSGAFDAVVAAARAEIARRPHFAQGALPSAVRAFVEDAVLAGTSRGSVILRVKPPTPPEPAEPTLEGMALPDPFERRAVMRLLDGVRAAKAATHQDFAAADEDAFDEAVEEGLSANLCDALLKLSGIKSGVDARVAVRVRWALTRRIRPTDEPTAEIEVDQGELRQLGRVAELLKEIQPEPHTKVAGPVTMVRRAPGEDVGVAHILAEIGGKVRTVRMALDRPDYDVALHAHAHELEIQAVGTLERAGTASELVEPTEVSIISSSS
jgi:hypothetical protein